MTGANKALLAGLPDRVQRLLAEPPAMEKMLIELNVAWPGLTAGLARMADAVRLFVITWDPLEGMVDRTGGFATTNGGSADLEIVEPAPCRLRSSGTSRSALRRWPDNSSSR